ncbi:MAG: ATP synthase F0 subunit B, partial [Bdellovibrionaceae bacterium]|nr:ATP synthase F0 subunit B [Pseudobdellovibrionaceae bacterium]
VFNVSILLGGLWYFLRAHVAKFFHDRRVEFIEKAQKSQRAKEEAEKTLLDIKHKIEVLNATAEESIARAEAEASDLKKSLLREAQELAQRIRHEAEVSVKIEVQKAHKQLTEAIIREAVDKAREILAKDIAAGDHKKLQDEFGQKVEGARL